jgi:hypothetical protein
MCCWTHENVTEATAPQHEEWRCRCGYGFAQCHRQATREDLLCDICGGREKCPPQPEPLYRTEASRGMMQIIDESWERLPPRTPEQYGWTPSGEIPDWYRRLAAGEIKFDIKDIKNMPKDWPPKPEA